jgi:hypothetical protein
MNWSNITLAKFQQIEAVNSLNLSDIDKVLFSVCIIYNMTEFELDNTAPGKVLKMTEHVSKVFESPFNPKAQNKIGRYFINYDISKITFGQYIELAFFLQDTVSHAHYIMATISKQWMRKHTANDHRKKANYFLTQPVTAIMGGVSLIKERFEEFNKEYGKLFGVDKTVAGDVQEEEFNKRYGWIYSATQVKEHEGIKLDDAFALPVRQALNDLVFLKAKGKYEAEQLRKNKPVA